MTFINYIWISNVLLRTLLAETNMLCRVKDTLKLFVFEKFQSEEIPRLNNIMIGFCQLLYTFKDEKVPLNDLFYNGVGEFNELKNTKYESMGLKITSPERQLNVLLKLFKQTSKTMQKTNKIEQQQT